MKPSKSKEPTDNRTPKEIETLEIKGMTNKVKTDKQTGYKGHTHKVMTTDKGVRIDPPEEPTWTEQALNAIRQGQDLNDFILHCHPDSRKEARKAYMQLIVRAVNHADKLAEALKMIRKALDGTDFEHTWANHPNTPEKSHTDLIDEALKAYEAAQ